jgi:hypothetical protein
MFVDDLFNKKTLTEAQGGGSPWHSEPEQQQMDADRRGRLGRERNAGLDEPDDAVSGSVQTGNGVYEYTVPAGQEGMAQELGLQQHRGHWVSRVPIQRANFQFGQPQFHEIPAQSGSAMNEDWRSEIQDIDDWANAVREKLKATPQAQRLSMAQKLSQIEKKNFGSETTDRQRYNNQTGNVDANRTMQGLSNVVYEVYMDLKNQANSGPVAGGFGSTGVDQSNMYAQQQAQYDTSMANHYQQHIDDYALMSDPDFMEWYEKAKESLLANSTDENARRWSADQVRRFGTKVIGQRNDIRTGYKDAYYTPQVKAILDNDVALAAEIERRQRRNFEEFMDNIEAWRKNWNNVSDKNKEKLANMTGQTMEDLEEIISSGNIDRESLSNPTDIRENSPYDFIKPGAMVKFGMWNKPQEHKTGRVVKMADGVVTVATDDGKNINLNLGNKSLSIAPVSADQQVQAEGATGRQVDAKGRTQAQWVDLVMKKFPTARIAQGRGPFSKTTAMLPDGRQLVWTPTMPDTINAVSRPKMSEGSDNPYGYEIGQTVKLDNGQQGRVIDIFDDSIEVLLVGGRTVTVDFRDAQVIGEGNAPIDHDWYRKQQERQTRAKQKQQGVAEGLPQTLRKVVPGYAKREIDRKMDAGKFGKTDADKDANFQRYKKIQDKLKEQGVAEGGMMKSIQRGLKGWQGSSHLDDIQDYIRNASDKTLVRLYKNPGESPYKQTPRDIQIKLINRELKRRYGVKPGEPGVAEAGNKPVEKYRLGMGDNRTARELKTQMQGASDEFVNRSAKEVGPFHSRVAKMQGKLAKSELRRREQGVGEGMMDNPGEQDSPVAQAIIRRILLQRTDLLAKHGPEKVGQAVDEVADFVGDVDEIGSSDVSGWVRHVEQMLGNMEEDVAEGNMISKIKAPAAPSSPALAAPRAPAVAETLAQIDRMLESVNSKKSAEIVKAYADQQFTKLGLRNTTECRNLMSRIVQESAVRRRAYAQRMAK